MRIDINELEKFFKKLVEKAEMCGFSQVEINEDFYWNLLAEESFNLDNPSPKVTAGSLEDDYDSLKQMILDDSPTPVDFDRLAYLLLAFSHSISLSDKPFA